MLEIVRVVGDREIEATVLSSMAFLLSRMARVGDAIEFQRRAIVVAEQTRHPALEQMEAFLIELEHITEGVGDGYCHD